METSRLTDADVYRHINRVEEGWDDDEMFITRRLQTLARLLEDLSEPHREQALRLYAHLCRARLQSGPGGRVRRPGATLAELRAVVAAWERNRPTLVACGHDYGNGRRCAVADRNPRRLAEHRYYVHDGPVPGHLRETAT